MPLPLKRLAPVTLLPLIFCCLLVSCLNFSRALANEPGSQGLIQAQAPVVDAILMHRLLSGAVLFAIALIGWGAGLLFFHHRLKKLLSQRTTELAAANNQLLKEIDRRKETEKASAEKEAKFSSIINASSDAIIFADVSGMVCGANAAAERLFGYPLDELTQLNLTALMPARYREAHCRGIARVVKTRKSTYLNQPLSFEGRHKNGTEFPLELNVATWFVGEEQFFSGIIRDVTERQAAEQALRESEEKLNLIFNSTKDGIVVANAETRKFLTGNRAICEMLGYSAQEITTLQVDDIHPAASLPEVHRQFARQARQEIEVYHNAPVKRRDGTVFLADISATPAIINHQQYLIGLFRDVTERNELEARARHSQKLEAIGTLAGGIAHDFNNILSAILGYSELALAEATPDSTIAHDLNQVIKAGSRAKELVKQILTLSRQSTTTFFPLRVQMVIKEVLKLLRPTLPATIAIQPKIDEQCAPIEGDPTQIHQILMNLCTNAFHAMENSGGTLTISLREIAGSRPPAPDQGGLPSGRQVKLEVRDTGTGIGPEIMDHIFDPYFTTKPHGKGSGLGLAVVHGIVETHRGKITCTSSPATGTVFSIFFPVIESSAEKAEQSWSTPPAGHERILFVDDEQALASLGATNLEALGYTVVSVTSSLEALELFRLDPRGFDLVISDQTMPQLPGSELAKNIMAIRPDIPIILCTGYSSTINDQEARAMGVKAFMMKPVGKLELARTVRKVLNERAR